MVRWRRSSVSIDGEHADLHSARKILTSAQGSRMRSHVLVSGGTSALGLTLFSVALFLGILTEMRFIPGESTAFGWVALMGPAEALFLLAVLPGSVTLINTFRLLLPAVFLTMAGVTIMLSSATVNYSNCTEPTVLLCRDAGDPHRSPMAQPLLAYVWYSLVYVAAGLVAMRLLWRRAHSAWLTAPREALRHMWILVRISLLLPCVGTITSGRLMHISTVSSS